ncbi:MAG: hypothetical protein ABIS18_11520 [Actinomycetota bacterium]
MSIFLVACQRSRPATTSILDSPTRSPNDEGVVTGVTNERITLDNKRFYKVSPKTESFIASSKQLTSIISTDHRYVQLGIKSGTVIWISTVGIVTRTDPPIARYTGTFLRKDADGRAVFKDGTVLSVRSGVKFPDVNKKIAVTIDPSAHEIIEFPGA